MPTKTVKTLCVACLALVGACVEVDVADSQMPIVGGAAHTGDPAVPQILTGLSGNEGSSCSGTLISPRVVLTAAHCLDFDAAISSQRVHFGSTTNGNDPHFVESIDVVDRIFYPGWSLSGGDVGMVLLEREAVTTPREINRTTLNSAYYGDSIRLVGWGDTDEDAGDAGVKRQVYSSLAGFRNPYVLEYGTYNANTCQGDSGGPGFMTVSGQEVVAGITSYGTGGCRGESGSTRVAAFADWIDAWVAAKDIRIAPTATITRPTDGAIVNSFFTVEVEAQDNIEVAKVELYINGTLSNTLSIPPYVFNAVNLPTGNNTLQARAYDNFGDTGTHSISVNVDLSCQGPSDCPNGSDCIDGECVAHVGTGELGEQCVSERDCISGLCGNTGNGSVCTQHCSTAVGDCPDGFVCVSTGAGGTQGACLKDDGSGDHMNDDAPVGGSGGCSLPGHGAPSWFVLGLGWLLLRRRRTRHLM